MHKKTSKRSISLTAKVKHPHPSTSMTVHEIEENVIRNKCPVVIGQDQYCKTAVNIGTREHVSPSAKADDDSWSWDRRSSGTSISWPEEMEEVATKRVIDQWEAVQRTLYDENDQVTSEELRAECVQWRTQRPHLRIIGKKLLRHDDPSETENPDSSVKRNDLSTGEEIIEEHSVAVNIPSKQTLEFPRGKYREETGKEVLDLILDFVCSELLAKNKDDKLLSENLDTVLRITPAPTYSGRNPLRSHSTANEFVNHRTKSYLFNGKRDCSVDPLKFSESMLPQVHRNNFNSGRAGYVGSQPKISSDSYSKMISVIHKFHHFSRGNITSISARRQREIRDSADGVTTRKDRLYTPQLPRNALGTVFTEKIIVSPVPFATTTKESFSTLKSTPLRSMRLSLDSAPDRRSARIVNSGFKATSGRRAGLLQIPQVHSAWQAPVCPTVWPKNVKLAPIDATRLPSSLRRSLATSPVHQRRSRNSLSPIPLDIIPVSHLAVAGTNDKSLEVHGKQIVDHKSRVDLTSGGWDSSPRDAGRLSKKNHNNQR